MRRSNFAAVLLLVTAAAWSAAQNPPDWQPDNVYYDWLDESGTLRGGRTSLMVPAPVPVPTIPASYETLLLRDGPMENRIDLVTVGDGYLEGELSKYATHVSASLATMFSQEPFKTYADYFNLHRVNVISNESGVDHDPTYPLWRDTAMDMGFWCGNIERLLCVDVNKARGFAQNAPDVDLILAVANSTKYGGAGYTSANLATVSGGNGSAAEVAIHEFGHSLGDLADEYDYGDGARYNGPERPERNISILTEDLMRQQGTKWAKWLGVKDPLYDGLVSTYEGAYYCQYGIHRPTRNSKIRSLGRPFNLPSIEGIIIEIYKFVRPIDASTPTSQPLVGTEIVFVDPVDPVGHALDIQWLLDETPIQGATGTQLDLRRVPFSHGPHKLGVVAVDNTTFARDEAARQQWLTERRLWDLQPLGVGPGDLNCDDAVNFADIDPFVLALGDRAAYEQRFQECRYLNGDFTGEGDVGFEDINAFVERLSGE